MTNEEAIERISDHMEVHKIGEYPHIKLAVALNMALDALRAQQTPATLDRSRWEGCNWCIGFCPGVTGDPHWYYRFCPICGRLLTEEAWAELEQKLGGGKM